MFIYNFATYFSTYDNITQTVRSTFVYNCFPNLEWILGDVCF